MSQLNYIIQTCGLRGNLTHLQSNFPEQGNLDSRQAEIKEARAGLLLLNLGAELMNLSPELSQKLVSFIANQTSIRPKGYYMSDVMSLVELIVMANTPCSGFFTEPEVHELSKVLATMAHRNKLEQEALSLALDLHGEVLREELILPYFDSYARA